MPPSGYQIVGTMVSKRLEFPRRSHVGKRKRPNPGAARGGTGLLGRYFSLDNVSDHTVGDTGAETMLMGEAKPKHHVRTLKMDYCVGVTGPLHSFLQWDYIGKSLLFITTMSMYVCVCAHVWYMH